MIKVFLFWLTFTCLMWVVTKIHYIYSDTCLNWKYFKEDYSTFGIIHYISLYIGCRAIMVYLIIKVIEWWFCENLIFEYK